MVHGHKNSKSSILEKAFPAPKFLTLNTFGIDISSKAVRIMKLKESKYGLIPDIYDEIVFENTCDLLETEEDLNRCGELRKALDVFYKKYKINFASVSIPERKTYIFKTTIPKEALDNVSEVVKFKIEENVPLDPREVIYDYQISNNELKLNKDKIGVAVTVLPRGVIETYTKLFDQVGIIPISFESESHSATRSMVSAKENDPVIVIHLGNTKINIAIVEDNIVNYTTSIAVDPNEVIKDFQGQEAKMMKEQLNKLLIYWFTNKHDTGDSERIEKAIVTGVKANAPGLVDFLEKGLKISVDIGNVWENCFSLDEFIPKIGHEKSLDYAVSIGLSLIRK